MLVIMPPATRQFVGIAGRDKPREDRLRGVALRDLDDDGQNALHPRRMPGRVLGEKALHVDAEMRRVGAERAEAQRGR
jgi:hypothetical protein